MTHEEEQYYKDNWPRHECRLLDPDAFPEGEFDFSSFVCDNDIPHSINDLIGCLKDTKPKIHAKMKKTHADSFSYTELMEPDTIIQVDEKQLNRICKQNGNAYCNCYSYPCNDSIRNKLCNSITVQYVVENAAPPSCPFCGSKIVPEKEPTSTKLYDIRLQGSLGRCSFEYKNYRCSNKNCKKRIPAYHLPEHIQYVDENRKSRFTTRLQDAVEKALGENYHPKRISQAYGFSRETAQSIATKKSKELKASHEEIEYDRIKKESSGRMFSEFVKKEKKEHGYYYSKEYYIESLKLNGSSFHAVFSLDSRNEICLTYIISEQDLNWLDRLVQCDFSVEIPKYSTAELNVLLYNYGRCKFPRVDHSLSYLLLRIALGFYKTYKTGKHVNFVAQKQLEKCFTHLHSHGIPRILEYLISTIHLLSDSRLIKMESKKALRYLSKVPMAFLSDTVASTKRNVQLNQWSKLAIEAIEAASTKCEGDADYIIGRLLYLNSAVIPFIYSFDSKCFSSPLQSEGEFWWPYFKNYEYKGIPVHCLMHLLKGGLLNDIDCPRIICSTDRTPNSSNHPCGIIECPNIIYDD